MRVLNGGSLTWGEQEPSLQVFPYSPSTPTDTFRFEIAAGQKLYEIGNHLGNVMAVITDRKIGYDGDADGHADYYDPDLAVSQDYYPFGMVMQNRLWCLEENLNYRFGFNTQEKTNEIYGNENLSDAEYWIFDSRMARRWNLDPINHTSLSAFSVLGDNLITSFDLRGNFNDWYVNGKVNTNGLTRIQGWKEPLIDDNGHYWDYVGKTEEDCITDSRKREQDKMNSQTVDPSVINPRPLVYASNTFNKNLLPSTPNIQQYAGKYHMVTGAGNVTAEAGGGVAGSIKEITVPVNSPFWEGGSIIQKNSVGVEAGIGFGCDLSVGIFTVIHSTDYSLTHFLNNDTYSSSSISGSIPLLSVLGVAGSRTNGSFKGSGDPAYPFTTLGFSLGFEISDPSSSFSTQTSIDYSEKGWHPTTPIDSEARATWEINYATLLPVYDYFRTWELNQNL